MLETLEAYEIPTIQPTGKTWYLPRCVICPPEISVNGKNGNAVYTEVQ
jgi:hypothetical protein